VTSVAASPPLHSAALSRCGWSNRARPAARFLRRKWRRARRGAGAQLRHGWHHGQDLPDRRLQAAHRAAVRGRPRRALPQGIGPAGARSR
jgi:hypothetical protein